MTDREDLLRYGDPQTHNGFALVTLLDAMGFSSECIHRWDDPEAMVLRRALAIRDGNYLKNEGRVRIMAGPGGKEAHEEWVFRPFFVGDTVVLATALPSPFTDQQLFLSFAAIGFNYRYVLKCSIENGFLLRGAIELGKAYWDGNGLLGPAPTLAHHIESQVADYGRVVLGPHLLNVIRLALESDQEELRNRARTMLSVCHRCDDGLISLDPAAFLAGDSEEQKLILLSLRKLQDNSATNDRAARKYDWIIGRCSSPGERKWPEIQCVNSAIEILLSRLRACGIAL